jgi:hypothetical protein
MVLLRNIYFIFPGTLFVNCETVADIYSAGGYEFTPLIESARPRDELIHTSERERNMTEYCCKSSFPFFDYGVVK